MTRRGEHLLVGAAGLYVVFVGWAMASLSYDIWGAFVITPIVVMVTIPVLRRVFHGEDSIVAPIAIAGLIAKLAATAFRYWVAFDAYGGQADAAAYHRAGATIAEQIRGGDLSPITGLTSETGTAFLERVTGIIYAGAGSSRLAGFVVFSWLAYLGLVLFVRAAAVAVPGILIRRYAVLAFFAPTLLYWTSSIGKEAIVVSFLGLASYGGARLLVGRWRGLSLPSVAAGLAGVAFVRPHVAAMWAGALALALLVGVLTGSVRRGLLGRLGTFGLAVLALAGLTLVAAATLEYLDPADDDSSVDAPLVERVSDIFDETERRTSQGGSSFEVITISGPQEYPVAIARTLTRPLLVEVDQFVELLPALETTALLALAVVSWRRIANLPTMLRRSSYLVMAVTILVMFGVAFSSIGNLGVLTRQRSIVMPMLFLPYCLPLWTRRGSDTTAAHDVAVVPRREATGTATR